MEIQINFTIGEGIESAKSKKISGVNSIVLMGEDVPLIIYKFNDVQHPTEIGALIPPAIDSPESREAYKQALEDEQINILQNLLANAQTKIRLDRESREHARAQQIETLQRQEDRRQRNTLDRVFREPPQQ